MNDIKKESLDLHKKSKGKLEIKSKVAIKTRKDLTLAYTPGVAAVSDAIARDKNSIYDYTMKANSVAVVSDGSAVLGLGNIGAEAALPVMEGKAILFKEFADIDAFPICIKSQDPGDIVNIVKNIAPAFGGINLEDISAPRCFIIEQDLQDIGIPVMHDDQHGTAVVILAGIINAANVVGKEMEDLKIIISGAGAAGTATAKILLCVGYDRRICTSVKEIIICDSKGIIDRARADLNESKRELANLTNKQQRSGTLKDAMKDADVFIGVSAGGIVSEDMIKNMAKDPIIFAMANPVPEILPDIAKAAGARIVATGRSDFPNQVNNVLGFPGIFRGALNARAKRITNEMKLAAAYALAKCVKNPNEDKIIPDPLDKSVVRNVASAVKEAAKEGSY